MNTLTKEVDQALSSIDKVPSLTHLSGHQRGQVIQLTNQTYHLISDVDQLIIMEAELSDDHNFLAYLHCAGNSYEIEAQNNQGVRLNGTQISSALLSQGDIIEFENSAVLLKFDFVRRLGGDKINLATLFNDCIKRTRFEAKSRSGFIARLPLNILADLTEKGNLKFRVLVMVGLTLLLSLNVYQWFRSSNLEREVAQERLSLEGLTNELQFWNHDQTHRRELFHRHLGQ